MNSLSMIREGAAIAEGKQDKCGRLAEVMGESNCFGRKLRAEVVWEGVEFVRGRGCVGEEGRGKGCACVNDANVNVLNVLMLRFLREEGLLIMVSQYS